ncbi:MAG: glycosyl hydrolase-related protein, partial [Candidatus Bathyarchaeia archaeon]
LGAMEKNIEHTFEYAVVPHKGDWKDANLARRGMEFNSPLIVFKTIRHTGSLESEKSFVEVSPENIVVTAIKKGNGKELIIRLYEASGKASNGKIRLFKEIRDVYETDLLENKIFKMDPFGDTLEFKINEFEIKTFAFYL